MSMEIIVKNRVSQLENAITAAMKIRQARIDQDKTLTDVAHGASISRGYTCEIENAKKVPSVDVIERICDYLQLDKVDIMKHYNLLPESVKHQLNNHPKLQDILTYVDNLDLTQEKEDEIYNTMIDCVTKSKALGESEYQLTNS